MDESFATLLDKYAEMGIPKSSTSEVEKSQLKSQTKFVSLVGAAVEFSPGFMLSGRNRGSFQKLLEMLFNHFQESPDYQVRKGSVQLLKEISIELSGVREKTLHFSRKPQSQQKVALEEGDALKPLFNAFLEQLAVKAIAIPFQLNLEVHEEREFFKQLLEVQAMFVILFGLQFSQVIEAQLGQQYMDQARTFYNLAELFAQKQTNLKQFADSSTVRLL